MNDSQLSGVSDAGYGDIEATSKKFEVKTISIDDLVTELRHKYLTIIKSLYWEFFEEGQCGPEAVVVLMESADRALDHENTPVNSWEFIKTYILSGQMS